MKLGVEQVNKERVWQEVEELLKDGEGETWCLKVACDLLHDCAVFSDQAKEWALLQVETKRPHNKINSYRFDIYYIPPGYCWYSLSFDNEGIQEAVIQDGVIQDVYWELLEGYLEEDYKKYQPSLWKTYPTKEAAWLALLKIAPKASMLCQSIT